jgi:hypothetical protein
MPVHVLTSAKHWRMAAWMLASWFHFSDHGWPVVIHDDGTLPEEAHRELARLFPELRIILRSEADAAMAHVLTPFPFCAEFRQAHVLALKIFDTAHFAATPRFLVMDSDVLFFSEPGEILEWVRAEEDGCRFVEGEQEAALLSATEARQELGVKLWPRVETGICLLSKAAIDFDFCDRALAETSLGSSGDRSRVERTLFALCASRQGEHRLLRKGYESAQHGPLPRGAIARHYTGAARSRFDHEGAERLAPVLLETDGG